jgi:hypothetical protein
MPAIPHFFLHPVRMVAGFSPKPLREDYRRHFGLSMTALQTTVTPSRRRLRV